jgi:uncharacterized Zn finger protein (UPF0148 family)
LDINHRRVNKGATRSRAFKDFTATSLTVQTVVSKNETTDRRDTTFFGPEFFRTYMSSDDASESGFDKEAEREKLREKYEADQQGRENTRRMSELLLKGATMTGKHCGECGDPIFRYDGEEFCPTCQREVEGAAGGQGSDEGDADARDTDEAAAGERAADEAGTPEDAGPDVTAGEPAENAPSAERESHFDGEPRVEINDVRVADRHADRSNLRQPPSQQGERDQRGEHPQKGHPPDRKTQRRASSRSGSHDHGPHEGSRAHSGGRTHARDSGAGDLATARESLVRKLTDLARRAEETDDVARSRDLLEATREAAEALAALDRANR